MRNSVIALRGLFSLPPFSWLPCHLSFTPSRPPLLDRFQATLFRARELTYRDNNRFFLTPDKSREWGAYHYGTEAFSSVPEGSLILADFAPLMVLRYFQAVQEMRPDVKVWSIDRYHFPDDPERFLEYLSAHIDHQPIFLADDEPRYYFLKALQKEYRLSKRGVLYRVERK